MSSANLDMRSVLERVATGDLSPDEALRHIQTTTGDLGFANVDLDRQHRRGRPEVIYCAGKTESQITDIARVMIAAGQNVLMTRLSPEFRPGLRAALVGHTLEENEAARTLFIPINLAPRKAGMVGVLCAGTSDIPVAEEAAVTAESLGSPVERLYDVGVAGLHRLLRHSETLRRARVLVVVAGMEGALASVVGGLVRAPVIAVPTSIGYGASFGGIAALLAMLNSCAPGVSVVNIDNGFGAGYLADVINGIGEGKERVDSAQCTVHSDKRE